MAKSDTVTENGVAENLEDTKAPTISAPVPPELKDLLTKAADERKVSNAALLREIVAGYFHYTIPEEFAVREKMSDEERKNKIRAKNALVKQLLDLVKQGKIVLTEDGIKTV